MSIADQFKPAGEGPQVRDLDLDLFAIKLDQSAQPREALNNDRIAEYAEGMKAGDQFPPLTVFHDGETYWLADGFHRHYAAQHAGRKHIRCHVRQGGLRDAILWSVGANAKHGLARSDEDKKRAVMRLLEDAEWATWTDRDIAKRCRVSHPFVAKIRKAHAGVTGNITSERTYRTKHGTTATMQTASINASRAKSAKGEKIAPFEGGDETEEITPETQAPQGVEGGGQPEIAAEEITPSRIILDELVALWCEADQDDRDGFIAYLRILGFEINSPPAAISAVAVAEEPQAPRPTATAEIPDPQEPTSSPVTADKGDGAPPPASSPAHSDPLDPGPIPAFLDRREKKGAAA